MSVECFAQRLLNPYRGVMHTIRYASAEAVTLDGAHWDIYVSNDALLEGLDVNRWTQITDIRYGSWSQAQGLKRGPLYPSDDFKRLEEMGAMVYEHLTRVHRQVPFKLQDQFELWLLDSARRPLALFSSVLTESAIALDEAIIWRAGYAAAEQFFSPAWQRAGGSAEPAADYLTRYINRCAGPAPVAQWFRRQADGSGAGLGIIGADQALAGRNLPAQDFPQLLLAATGYDTAHAALIADFLAWQAPWLLSLSRLENATRQQLEQQARQQALAVEKHYRLYPEILDHQGIKAALVEALLRRNQGHVAAAPDTTMSTFYIELHPSPGGDRSI
jgi:hypothetical protein